MHCSEREILFYFFFAKGCACSLSYQWQVVGERTFIYFNFVVGAAANIGLLSCNCFFQGQPQKSESYLLLSSSLKRETAVKYPREMLVSITDIFRRNFYFY